MPLRDADTPSAAQLDTLAHVTSDDIDRAKRTWRANVSAPRAALRTLLDATTSGNVGPATGPIADGDA